MIAIAPTFRDLLNALAVRFVDGAVLFVGGLVAMAEACCCAVAVTCETNLCEFTEDTTIRLGGRHHFGRGCPCECATGILRDYQPYQTTNVFTVHTFGSEYIEWRHGDWGVYDAWLQGGVCAALDTFQNSPSAGGDSTFRIRYYCATQQWMVRTGGNINFPGCQFPVWGDIPVVSGDCTEFALGDVCINLTTANCGGVSYSNGTCGYSTLTFEVIN